MQYHGALHKMSTQYGSTVRYTLKVGGDLLLMNALIGREFSATFLGEHICFCGQLVPEVYRQNFCRECFFTKPEASPTIMKPELSKAHLGIAERDLEFEQRLQLQPHFVYLAKTDRIKVGVTRGTQRPYRWMDQGAAEAAVLLELPNRYLAGIAEVALKAHVADKTSWQKMLKNEVVEADLIAKMQALKAYLPEEVQPYFLEGNKEVYELEYPVLQFPVKVKSLNLIKEESFKGILKGIKGQYLIFEDGTVFNVRNNEGLVVSLELN